MTSRRPKRILYAAGPGDVIRTYRHWARGEEDPTQVSMTSSGMFYDLCRDNGYEAYVISTCPRRDSLHDGSFTIVQHSMPFESGPGPLYHLGQILAGLRLAFVAFWFRADVAVIVCGSTYWFVARLLPLLGIRVVASLHCVLYPKYRPLKPLQRLLRQMSRTFFIRDALRILTMSEDIAQQVIQTTEGRQRPVLPFLPTYRRDKFDGIYAPDAQAAPFRVLFAGRLERNKGVFDLLSIAGRFAREGRIDIEFHICGSGSESAELARQAELAGVAGRFHLHGYCSWTAMREHYSTAHAVIVPTTSEFVEGFNQVIAEAVLAGRPVITSEVCPAIFYVRQAVVEVPVDDVKAYGDAILKLRDEPAFYREKVLATARVREQFLDLDRSWKNALRKALREAGAPDRVSSESQLQFSGSEM
jgi:glycogen(starch) synthase